MKLKPILDKLFEGRGYATESYIIGFDKKKNMQTIFKRVDKILTKEVGENVFIRQYDSYDVESSGYNDKMNYLYIQFERDKISSAEFNKIVKMSDFMMDEDNDKIVKKSKFNKVKIKTVETEVESVDEWVILTIKIDGTWDANTSKDELLEMLLDFTKPIGKKLKKKLDKYKGKAMYSDSSPGDDSQVKKSIPIPTSTRDFDNWEVSKNSAWFSTSYR